jgi:O-antigen/teichoic acid export membrane protein
MLTTRTILGAGWTVSGRLAGRAVDFVTVLVLARALTPADFGLTAIASTLVVILDALLDIPLIWALTSLKSVTKSHLDTAFTLGALRGVSLFFILLASAWPFAYIYGDSRLPALIAALAVGPIARSLYSPGMVTHVRELSFRQNFTAELAGRFIASVAAISVLYLGGGYWAIVVSGAFASVATTIISYVLAPYRPRLSLSRFSEFSSFLGWFSTAQIFKATSWQFDRILLGYFVTKSDLGQYTTASDLAIFPMQSLIAPAMQPLMAGYSKINDDRDRLRSAYLKASRLTMILAAPTCIGISLTSDLLVDLLLGAKWTETGLYLQWLSLSIVLGIFYQPMNSLALATRRTNLVFRLSVMEACCRIALVLAGLYVFKSLMGVIIARVAMSVIMFIMSMLAARSMTGATLSSQVINLWKVAAASAAMTVLVLMMRHGLQGATINVAVQLALIAAFGAAIYVAALSALGVRPRHYLSGLGAPG